MARPLRREYEDGYYSVMSRGRGRGWISSDVEYYEDCLSCLAEACMRLGIENHAYCLMANHYYLLIKIPRGNLSRQLKEEVRARKIYNVLSQDLTPLILKCRWEMVLATANN